jgi:hypothetical protein
LHVSGGLQSVIGALGAHGPPCKGPKLAVNCLKQSILRILVPLYRKLQQRCDICGRWRGKVQDSLLLNSTPVASVVAEMVKSNLKKMLNGQGQDFARRVREIFDVVADLAVPERNQFLDSHLFAISETDRVIREEVERLLTFHERSGFSTRR